jgi:hypothetical protein
MWVWFLQSLSAYLSHRFSVQKELHGVGPATWRSLGAFAVYTRLAGNLLAIANTLWIVTLSFLQFTNVYNNCWCASAEFQNGPYSFVVVIATQAMIYAKASTPWITGTFIAIASSIFCVLFFTLSMGNDLFRMDAQ